MPNPLQSLQEAIVVRLKEDELLSQVEIMAEDRMDLEAAIQLAMAQLGVVLVVQTVSVGVANPNLPGPNFDSVRFTVAVVENTTLNRAPGSAQLDALSLAIATAQRLHHWRPVEVAQFSGYTVLAASNTIEYQQSDDVLAYDVNFTLGS